jgi:RNA polymerase sigma factor (sigma-70 family)
MSPGVTKSAAVPHDPVGAAMEDPEVQTALLMHALAVLGRRLSGRSAADRLDKARDACQETYARALRKRAEFNPALSAAAWLHGILHYVLAETVASVVRSPSQESAHPEAWAALATTLHADAAATLPAHLDLASIMAKLAPEHKELIRLKYGDGLSHADIAARLGISTANARVRLCRALMAARTIAGVALKEDRP